MNAVCLFGFLLFHLFDSQIKAFITKGIISRIDDGVFDSDIHLFML
jgi:hypothetical protein